MRKRTRGIFEELDVHVDPKAIMSTLPVSQRQMVEIAKAVSYNAKIIVFDEPTSSLTEAEVEELTPADSWVTPDTSDDEYTE